MLTRLFPVCNLALLAKLSAWHFVHMYDEGLIEPALNPSFNLAWGLDTRDRLQYLREMTTGRSIWWLEQGRWLDFDGITESLTHGRPKLLDITISDMSLLLLLLLSPDSDETDTTTRNMASLVVKLALLLLSCADIPQWSFSYMHHCVEQCFNSIRCWKLGRGGHHSEIVTLAYEMDRNTELFRDGWEMYCNMLGVKVLSRDLPFQNGVVGDEVWPLFLNPMKLVGRNWSEVSDQFPFLGRELRSDIASTPRFELTPGTLTYVPTPMGLRPDVVQLADSVAISGNRSLATPSILLPVPVFRARQFEKADLRYGEDATRQLLLLRRLSPLISGIMKVQASDAGHEFTPQVAAVRESVREVLAHGLRRGLRVCDAPLKLKSPMLGRLFILGVSTACYCVHRFYKRDTQASITKVVQAIGGTSSVADSAKQEWESALARTISDGMRSVLAREGFLPTAPHREPKCEPSRRNSVRLTRLREKLENQIVLREIKKLETLDDGGESKVATEVAVETNGRQRRVERNGATKPPNSKPRKPIQEARPRRRPIICVLTAAANMPIVGTSNDGDVELRGLRLLESQAALVIASASTIRLPSSFCVGEVVVNRLV